MISDIETTANNEQRLEHPSTIYIQTVTRTLDHTKHKVVHGSDPTVNNTCQSCRRYSSVLECTD